MSTSKRDILMDAALALFQRDGYHATGVDAIIAQAGVAKMTLYKHFGSKDELIVAALERQADRVMDGLEGRVAELAADPARRLVVLFDAAGEQCAARGFRGCLFQRACGEFGEAGNPVHAAAGRFQGRLRAFVLGLAREAGALDPEALADELLVLYSGAAAMAQGSGCAGPFATAKRTAGRLVAEATGRAA